MLWVKETPLAGTSVWHMNPFNNSHEEDVEEIEQALEYLNIFK